MSEHEDRAAAKERKSEQSKEARKRLKQIMMLRGSPLLKALTEREISDIASKALLQRFEKGDEIITQGEVGTHFAVVVAGELDAIQKFGEEPFVMEESKFVLTSGKTFLEEAILQKPARMTVRALKPVELGLIEVRHCEFLVNESPDARRSIERLLNWQEDHKPIFDLLMERKSMLLNTLKDHELKALAKYVTLKPMEKDTLVCREKDFGSSMFVVIRYYSRLVFANRIPRRILSGIFSLASATEFLCRLWY